jgi:hypothetical protein
MTYSGRGIYHCDTCPEHIDTEEQDFGACLAALKQKGWRTYKGPDGLWAHSCPSCTEDFAKEKRRQ